MNRNRCCPTFPNHAFPPGLTPCPEKDKENRQLSDKYITISSEQKREAVGGVENIKGEVLLLTLWGKVHSFVLGNYGNVGSCDITLPPQDVLCPGEINVLELYHEKLTIFKNLSLIERKQVLAKCCPLKYTDFIQN
jgi:hypothetical protein